MSLRGIVFDLDGTLVDSLEDITASLNHALVRHGLPERDAGWIRRNVGQGATHLITQALKGTDGEAHREGVLADFVTHYEAHPCDATRPYPGVSETLAACHDRGLTLAVLSNKPTGITRRVIEALRWNRFFRFVWGGDSFPERKPSPLPLQEFLTAAGLPPSDVLMVGDSSADVGSARAAGIRCAFFPGGYGQLEGLELMPDYELHSMRELVPLLDRLEQGT